MTSSYSPEDAARIQKGGTTEPSEPISVLHQVYEAFADALGDQEGCEDAAERLRKTLVQDGKRSESVLRAALFGSESS